MAHYGQVLEDITTSKGVMLGHFDDYFNHPVMIKIKDVQGHSMYMRKTHCLLSKECRYIIAFTKADGMPPYAKERLIDLDWVSLQTRTLADKHDIPSHSYQPRAEGPLNVKITRTGMNEKQSTYDCEDFPITVVMLNPKEGLNEYQQKGNIIAALETYNTIICIKEQLPV